MSESTQFMYCMWVFATLTLSFCLLEIFGYELVSSCQKRPSDPGKTCSAKWYIFMLWRRFERLCY